MYQTKNIKALNVQYMRNSTIVYWLKMDYVSKITIFALKMMMKSGLEKILLKFLYAHYGMAQFIFTNTF